MIKTTNRSTETYPITVDTEKLAEMLGCGKPTARRIGADANARVTVGRRVLYNVAKIQKYVEGLSE